MMLIRNLNDIKKWLQGASRMSEALGGLGKYLANSSEFFPFSSLSSLNARPVSTYLQLRGMAYTDSTMHISLHLDNSLGSVFLGLIFAAILFGVTNMQSFIYFQNSARDPNYIKWMVAFLWTLDAFHLAIICHALYVYLVTDFADLIAITKPTWSLCLQVIVTGTSDSIVRLYYARRVWIMSRKSWILTFGVLALNLVVFTADMAFGIKIFFYKSNFDIAKISWLIYTSLGTGVAADLWVALSLCYFLTKDRSEFKATDTRIKTLMLYVISTGLLTSICSIGCFVSYAAMPRTYVFMGFYLCLSKLYFNALLAMLNARDHLRDGIVSSGLVRNAGYVPRFVNIGQPHSEKNNLSFGTDSVASRSPAQAHFSPERKPSTTFATIV